MHRLWGFQGGGFRGHYLSTARWPGKCPAVAGRDSSPAALAPSRGRDEDATRMRQTRSRGEGRPPRGASGYGLRPARLTPVAGWAPSQAARPCPGPSRQVFGQSRREGGARGPGFLLPAASRRPERALHLELALSVLLIKSISKG